MNDDPFDDNNIVVTDLTLDPIARLTRDMRDAARVLSDDEARFLVDAYYAMQGDRIRAGNQLRALSESAEPNSVMQWLGDQRLSLEKQVARALNYYSAAHKAGEWARSITGIGPIIAAGLLAHIDIKGCPTVGHVWRYAGLDPTSKWLGTEKATDMVRRHMGATEEGEAAPRRRRGSTEVTPELLAAIALEMNMKTERLHARMVNREGETVMTRAQLIKAAAKRPWNASLKRLCYLIGESFVKVHKLDSDHYGKVYAERKVYEQAKNEKLDYKAQAEESLATKNFGADTDARKWYEKGMLPPARIHRRSCRYAVKLFLSHYHHVAYETEFKAPPPMPYIITHGGHTHYLAPPNWTPIKP
jgi:hypothetical protein